MEAAARGRRECENHAGRSSSQALGRGWKILPLARRRHVPTERRLKYGELAAEAAKDAPPRQRHPEIAGTIQADRHADQAARCAREGQRESGLWHRRSSPGVKIATLVQSPVFGGRVKSLDATAAKAVNGLRQIIWLDDAVAVVADHMGAANEDLAALRLYGTRLDGTGRRTNHGQFIAPVIRIVMDGGQNAQTVAHAQNREAGPASGGEHIVQSSRREYDSSPLV